MRGPFSYIFTFYLLYFLRICVCICHFFYGIQHWPIKIRDAAVGITSLWKSITSLCHSCPDLSPKRTSVPTNCCLNQWGSRVKTFPPMANGVGTISLVIRTCCMEIQVDGDLVSQTNGGEQYRSPSSMICIWWVRLFVDDPTTPTHLSCVTCTFTNAAEKSCIILQNAFAAKRALWWPVMMTYLICKTTTLFL